MGKRYLLSFAAIAVLTALFPSVSESAAKNVPPEAVAYSLKDGSAWRGEEELGCEIYEIPEGIANGIVHWAAVGTGTSETVTQEETGVWFFDGKGGVAAFIQLESENEYQGIAWSPAGDRLILVRGSGVRPDMFFDLYGPGMKKQAEFPGLSDGIQWLDDARFVFTRIDEDIREGGSFLNLGYGLRLSTVLYDSVPSKTIVLKEATDTQNFSFAEISNDGKNIVISEEYVKSPEDWGDEEKIQQREVTVPVPPTD
jgi:dipeptidyl aminopeptidase/acylaminoacyl peptidase